MFDISHAADGETASAQSRPAERRVAAIRPTDGERLMQFRQHRDDAAFRAVVEAHAGLVWGVCWQVLRHREDVEDAFQATFLILARKASAIRAAESAAGWLYRVAFRTALAARARRRRLGVEPLVESLIHEPPGSLDDQLASIERAEQCEALLEELHSLGDRYRQPLVLCYLEGRSRQEAADELGMTLASVKGRLARGLRMLRTRMAYRGLALSGAAALLAGEMSAAQASLVTAPIAETAALGSSLAWVAMASTSAAAAAEFSTSTSPGALLLAKKGILAMKLAALVKPAMGLLAVGMTAGAMALAGAEGPKRAARGSSDDASSTAVVELTAEDADATGDQPALPPNTFIYSAPEPGAAVYSYTADGAAGSLADVAEPADVLISVNPDAKPEPGAGAAKRKLRPRLVKVSAPQPFTIPVPPPTMIAATGTTGLSRKSMELELDHWTLKAHGLQKKAEALRMQAQALARGQGDEPRREALDAEAESELTLAEVKLCEARAQQLRDALEGREETAVFQPPQAPGVPVMASTGQVAITEIAPPLAAVTASPLVVEAVPTGSENEARRHQLEALRRASEQLQEQIRKLESQISK